MSKLRKFGKISAIVLAVILGLFLLIFGGFNALKFAIYSEYYGMRTNLCKNPGLSDGFFCQGVCAYEQEEKIIVSGYMANKSPSRLYVTDLDNNSYYVIMENEGKSYYGHAGGVAVNGDYLYMSGDDKIYVISVGEVLKAQNGDTVQIQSSIPVNNNGSFIYADEQYLYVGEFHDGGKYVTEHPYDAPEGKNYAIVSRYAFDDLTAPNRVYSIRNKVQGICFTPDGKVVMSTSYGLSSSVYYVYNQSDAVDLGVTLDGAPVYGFNECVKQFSGPAMAEGLDYYNGKIITLTESASNKYIFGKFFFANKIVALDVK